MNFFYISITFLKNLYRAQNFFRNSVAPLCAKMRFRPKGGIAFVPLKKFQT